MNDGSIWVIDDDRDDHELIEEIVNNLELTNELVFFNKAKDFLERLETVPVAPFIIICDVNLRGTDGFELRETVLNYPNKKYHAVPFIFWSTSASEEQIRKAYKLRAHGFFIKEAAFEKWKALFATIISYWHQSKVPSKRDSYEEPL